MIRRILLAAAGLLSACRDDDAIEVYARDPETGALSLQKDRTVRLNHPVCVQLF